MVQVRTPTNPLLLLRRQRLLLFAVLLLSSALSVTLSLLRIWYSDTRHYAFLNWNLILAWAPLALAFVLWRLDRRRNRRPLLMALLFGSWLLFFPNSPYLVSDLIHINARDNVPLWYDAMMIFTYAWNGLILGFVSLWIIQQMTARRLGWFASWIFVTLTLAATGFGIYLGRFQRWNSWDVLVDPLGIVKQVLQYLFNPFDYPRTIGVTLLFGGFLIVAYLTLTLLPLALRGLSADGVEQSEG